MGRAPLTLALSIRTGEGEEIRIKITIRSRKGFQDPADGEVVFAGEVDAGEELGARAVGERGGGERLRCG